MRGGLGVTPIRGGLCGFYIKNPNSYFADFFIDTATGDYGMGFYAQIFQDAFPKIRVERVANVFFI